MPWGEAVGERSFETLSKIYTGYGEKGPSQGSIRKLGHKAAEGHPLLDFMTRCDVVQDQTHGAIDRLENPGVAGWNGAGRGG